jgi:hypothetical protein
MGIQLLPMNFGDLEQAVELRKQCAQAANITKAAGSSPTTVGKRSRGEHDADDSLYHQIQAESSYLMLSSRASAPGTRNHQRDRTGRWSSEEVGYVDQIVAAFDQGALPLPHGVKLNEFLGDMLLCKSSRLTKKMKNAKLSTRSFTLQSTMKVMSDEQCLSLSFLIDNFLKTVPSDPMQLELKFNMTKLWRTHFSNLCLQVGYDFLDARDWLLSLEEMERRASDSEELIRKARRRRMGLALRQDVGPASNHGVFIGGVPANKGTIAPPITFSSDVMAPMIQPTTTMMVDPVHFLSEASGVVVPRLRTMSDDFSMGILEDLMDPRSMMVDGGVPPHNSIGDCGPFLTKVVHYIENENVPFEHVDVWVPSFRTCAAADGNSNDKSKPDTLRLFHAGHATRSDVDSSHSFQLHEYGVYSTNFSFAPGVGLPGRVYTLGSPSWECNVYNADPTRFERAGGAQVYGVRTAVGIPLDMPDVGRIVLVLYSTKEIEENQQLLQRFATEFAKWIPKPKWKLEKELGEFERSHDGHPSQTAVAQTVTSKSSAAPSAFTAFHRPGGADQTTGLTAQETNKAEVVAICPVEKVIASLLGDHMPGPGDDLMLPHFMHLRLLLLRAEDRRTQHEKELLDVIKKSCQAYSEDKKRTDAELASLLARDWKFLSASPPRPASTPLGMQHHVHALSTVTPSPSGQPMRLLTQVSYPPRPASGDLAQASLPPVPALSTGDSSKLIHWRHSFEDLNPMTETNGSAVAERSQAWSATVVPHSPRDSQF